MSEVDFQLEIGQWANITFPERTRQSILNHLADELIELCGPPAVEAALQKWVSRHSSIQDDLDIRDEASDIGLLLKHLAYIEGFSLSEAEREKFEVCKSRTWDDPDERGVRHHR